MECDSRDMCAQNLITEWSLCFFHSFGGASLFVHFFVGWLCFLF